MCNLYGGSSDSQRSFVGGVVSILSFKLGMKILVVESVWQGSVSDLGVYVSPVVSD